jgi:chromate transporter
MKELALLFLRLGLTAFGGPAAHIAMMEEEVVRRRKWLTAEEFLDLVGATNLIPGPNSTELAIHIGYRRAGWLGLIVAGSCFIVPAAGITLALAWVYVRFGKLPQAQGLMRGIKPVMIAVVLQALWRLGKTAIRTQPLAALGIVCIGATVLGVEELIVLFGAGLIVAATRSPKSATPIMSVAGAGPIFLVFAKIGSVLFGSGYVLLAFLRTDLVERRPWLSESQLVDAIAVGQVTPGPVFTTATFVGYLIDGFGGAAAATLGIFLPAFFFVAVSGWLLPKLRSPRARGFLDGVNVASLALMAVVTVRLGQTALVDVTTVVIAVISAALLLKTKVSSFWLILAGGVIGVIQRVL